MQMPGTNDSKQRKKKPPGYLRKTTLETQETPASYATNYVVLVNPNRTRSGEKIMPVMKIDLVINVPIFYAASKKVIETRLFNPGFCRQTQCSGSVFVMM